VRSDRDPSSPPAPPAGWLAGRLQHTINVPSHHELYRQFVDVYLVELDKEVAPLRPVSGGMSSTQTFMRTPFPRSSTAKFQGQEEPLGGTFSIFFVSSLCEHSNVRSRRLLPVG